MTLQQQCSMQQSKEAEQTLCKASSEKVLRLFNIELMPQEIRALQLACWKGNVGAHS